MKATVVRTPEGRYRCVYEKPIRVPNGHGVVVTGPPLRFEGERMVMVEGPTELAVRFVPPGR